MKRKNMNNDTFSREHTSIQAQYLKIFEGIVPHLDSMKRDCRKYSDYKGWADIDSPILSQPDILFIGINSGAGRYKKFNYTCDARKTTQKDELPEQHKESRRIPDDYPTPWRSTLQYIIDGSARDKEWWNVADGD